MMLEQSSADQNMESACHGPPTSSREELIRRIKDGQSPTWIPNRAVSSLSLPEPSVPLAVASILARRCIAASERLGDVLEFSYIPPPP